MKLVLLKAILHRTAVLGGIWLVLSGAAVDAAPLGVVTVGASVWLSLRLLPATHPLVVWRLARHVPRFIAGSVVGGLDVARRAFSPQMPLNPGWLEVQSDLPDGARVALGGELSLMPGTLSAGTSDGKLLIHVLDTVAGFHDAVPQEERQIAAILGRADRGAA